MTIHLFIKPLDVWLFRDGRPFNRGTDHRARSYFPPLPSVLQGSLRTYALELHGRLSDYLKGLLPELNAALGSPGQPPPDTFRLAGPFLARWPDHDRLLRYFPLPAHAYRDGQVYRLLQPQLRASVLTDLGPEAHLLWRREGAIPAKAESEGGIWLDEDALIELLEQRELPGSRIVEGRTLFSRETRLGIQLDETTFTTSRGALYQAEFIRPCPHVGLYVAVDGLPDGWPQTGLLRLGGEGHTGSYQQLNQGPPTLQGSPAGPNGITITFLTPTYFKGGWQPISGDWTPFLDTSLECVAAAVDRFQSIGGFDLFHKRPKPARRYVPAGSTYYFKGAAKPLSSVICDNPTDARSDNINHIGFGQFILGGW